MIAIGVGNDVDYRELSHIAGEHVILLTSFDEVLTKAQSIIDQLTRKACWVMKVGWQDTVLTELSTSQSKLSQCHLQFPRSALLTAGSKTPLLATKTT